MEKTFDTIIIGGGIHGVSTAFHLAQRGVKSLIVERSTLASQATGRSSGLIRMHYALETDSRLAWESFQYFRDWDTRVGGDCGFVRTGFIQIVAPEYTDLLIANIANHQSIGIPTFLVNAADVQRLAPHFFLDDIDVAAYEPESGYADPSATTASLMDAARQRGARLLQGSHRCECSRCLGW
jgi:sarcosine oxidase subunit beta